MTEVRRAVLVDRDDTLCPDVPHNGDPAKMHVFPFVPAAVKRLNDAGFLVIVVTNQSGIGRGLYSVEDMEATNAEMESQISREGGHIDDVFFCPHRPDEGCSCRKPETGMGEQALSKWGFDPSVSFMVGDSDKDIEFGRRLGLRTIKVSSGHTFADAVEEILSF
ncbi:histidinol-phosphate phosphatase family domain/HAD-superfamily hydrolase, subfamily IIIA [Thermoplasmatales archaeon BRNA1]|nr:histidinol-phosphate phosphatase family domain/HAD-superfamily hydrolase, subfamily IIIA [Thermoplasmatales archaeon BRNA1]